MANLDVSSVRKVLLNGAEGAAILAVGIGCVALGVFTLLAEAFSGIRSV